jgi:hypothetical protein
MLQWLTVLNIRARRIRASRHARAITLPAAFSRMRELRGWLAGLPLDAWVYDLRTPGRSGAIRIAAVDCLCSHLSERPALVLLRKSRGWLSALDRRDRHRAVLFHDGYVARSDRRFSTYGMNDGAIRADDLAVFGGFAAILGNMAAGRRGLGARVRP